VLQRIFCLTSAIAAVTACSATAPPNKGISLLDVSGGAAGTTGAAANAGASAANGAGGRSTPWTTSPDNSGGTGIGIITPIPEVDAASTTKCVAVANQGKQVTVDIFIMFDQSKSMSCAIPAPSTGAAGSAGTGGASGAAGSAGAPAGAGGAAPTGGDRWGAVKGALESFVNAPAAAGINVGIQYFGLGGNMSPFGITSSCTPADYQGADVEIAPLPDNAPKIVASLNAHSPTTNTPTAPALTGAINHAIAWKNAHAGHAVIVVLVTDGQPNGCGTIADVVNVARMGFMSTIPTYVIGVTSAGFKCDIDANPPNQQDLDTVANAGGSNTALLVDVSKDVAQQFLDTMDKIRARSSIPCQYSVPAPPPGEKLDPTRVNVEYTPPGSTMPVTLTSVTQATCDPMNGGWYYDDPITPKTVTLCKASCDLVTAQVSGSINIALGCATKTTQ
jgi:hypothetical protein